MLPVKPCTMVVQCIHRNGLRVSRPPLAVAEQAAQPGLLGLVVRAALRLDPHLAAQRDGVDPLAARLADPSRAVSCGAAAYGSATMSRTVNRRSVMTGRPMSTVGAGRARCAARAKNSSIAALGLLAAVEAAPDGAQRPTSS